MASVDKTFQGKLIIKGLPEEKLAQFIHDLIMNGWTDRKIPPSMKFVNSGEKLTKEMLPKNFDPSSVATNAVKRGLLVLDKIGVVDFGLSLRITRVNGTNPMTRVEIDKFEFEKDGNNLEPVVNKTLKAF